MVSVAGVGPDKRMCVAHDNAGLEFSSLRRINAYISRVLLLLLPPPPPPPQTLLLVKDITGILGDSWLLPQFFIPLRPVLSNHHQCYYPSGLRSCPSLCDLPVALPPRTRYSSEPCPA